MKISWKTGKGVTRLLQIVTVRWVSLWDFTHPLAFNEWSMSFSTVTILTDSWRLPHSRTHLRFPFLDSHQMSASPRLTWEVRLPSLLHRRTHNFAHAHTHAQVYTNTKSLYSWLFVSSSHNRFSYSYYANVPSPSLPLSLSPSLPLSLSPSLLLSLSLPPSLFLSLSLPLSIILHPPTQSHFHTFRSHKQYFYFIHKNLRGGIDDVWRKSGRRRWGRAPLSCLPQTGALVCDCVSVCLRLRLRAYIWYTL